MGQGDTSGQLQADVGACWERENRLAELNALAICENRDIIRCAAAVIRPESHCLLQLRLALPRPHYRSEWLRNEESLP